MDPQDSSREESPQQPGSISQSRDDEELYRMAAEQVRRKRKFHERAIICAAIAAVVVIIWAISEYNNAGGWPNSFSESSGQPGVWNFWIIYPLLALALYVVLDACFTYLRKPVSESDIRREMKRLK